MAIFHFNGAVISRAKGRNAVVSAASRAEEKLYNEREGLLVKNNCNDGVFFKEILLPINAPFWMTDREKLWNAVEKKENRKDAQLARDISFSLPREISKEQNIELAREYAQKEFVTLGMVVDLCLHAGKIKDGKEQLHAHMMITMRTVTEDGFGPKERSWNAKSNYLLWRKSLAELINKYLLLNGIDQRVDHRSLVDQGIDLIPQKILGPAKMKLYHYKKEENVTIAKENGNRLLANPDLALKVIANRQSVFTDVDLVNVIKIYSSSEQFQEVYEKVIASKSIVPLGKNDGGEELFTIDFKETDGDISL